MILSCDPTSNMGWSWRNLHSAEMGFEKIAKIAHSRGVCKQQKVAYKLKLELYQAIGSIEAIAKEDILENTDLSSEKAEIINRFSRDPEFYLGPKFN